MSAEHEFYEIFSPPYLFKGPRPTITGAPSEVALNTNFFITTPDAASIVKISFQTTGSNSIDDARYFVRMHYQDFLERDPISAEDRNGLAFWTRNITQCGNDAACRDVKRRDVSTAF